MGQMAHILALTEDVDSLIADVAVLEEKNWQFFAKCWVGHRVQSFAGDHLPAHAKVQLLKVLAVLT